MQRRHLFRPLWLTAGAHLALAAAYFAYDWRYWVRHLQSPGDERIIFDFDWYEPVARVGEGPGRDVPVAVPETRTIDQATLDAVAAEARAHDTYAFIVAHRGIIQAEFYKDGFGPESVFDTQSMHKGLLGVVFGAAVDNGFIPSLDTPASTYITEWKDDARKEITVRQLLNNTAGLAEPPFSEVPWSKAYRLFVGTDVDNMVIGVPAMNPPGAQYSFNHVNSQILHAVLVRATGMDYVSYLKKFIWQPVGNGAAQVRLDRPGGSARTVCCFQTTARSWLRLAQMILDGGKVGEAQVLSPAWIADMTTGSGPNPKHGFHIHLGRPDPPARSGGDPGSDRARPVRASAPFAADDVRYLEGRGGQRTLWIPSKQLAVIRIGKIDFTWDDAKVVNPLIAAIKE